jgi:Zn-dependent M28 family amino/carboxypeptidase
MFLRLIRGLAPLALILATSAAAQRADPPVMPAEMMRHIERLASDAFQGRAPGTEGERLTTAYIVEQLQARGVEPAGENGGWFQPVGLVERAPDRASTQWTANGRPIPLAENEIVLISRDATARIDNAPVIFAGHGARLPDRGVDQLAGTDVRGAVVFILAQGPGVPGFPSLARRAIDVSEAGAAAVIVLVGSDAAWEIARAGSSNPVTRSASFAVPAITGFMPTAAAQRMIDAAGGNFERLLNEQPGSSFRAVTLPLRASLDVTSHVRRYTSNNVVGRIRGSGRTNESLLLLAHWDHLGVCRPEGEADRICNGAVDNASGIASLIEISGRLARRARPPRDVLVLATTAEENGLVGAGWFAQHPVVPLDSIVAAINMDTVAIHPAGEPVAVIGRGNAALDPVIDAAVAAMGRRLDTDDEAGPFIQRQDGWMLTQAGVPAIMIGGSFSNMALLNAFFESSYHRPNDQLGGTIVLDGAAEDATLTVALARRLADPSVYRRAPAAAAGQ